MSALWTADIDNQDSHSSFDSKDKAGWGQKLPPRVGRGVSVQNAFASFMASIADAEVAKDGTVRVSRVVCAVDCGIAVNPDTIRAQIQSAVMFGITAVLYGEIT